MFRVNICRAGRWFICDNLSLRVGAEFGIVNFHRLRFFWLFRSAWFVEDVSVFVDQVLVFRFG